MPSTYAHYRMGQEVYRNLTGKPKQIIEKYKELYDIGLHGPDILFYYKPLFANPVNQVGYAMHDRPGIEAYFTASAVILHWTSAVTATLMKKLRKAGSAIRKSKWNSTVN